MTPALLPLVAALAAPACLAATRELPSPAREGARVPFLASAPDGVYMSWLQRGPGKEAETELRFSRWDGARWTPPRRIASGRELVVNWADFPSLAVLPGGGLAAHWLAKTSTAGYHYDVRVSTSGDGGRSWSRPSSPHRDGTFSEHGFAALVPAEDGAFHAVWLDGRRTVAPRKGAQALYVSRYDGRAFAPERELDSRVCDCCHTAAAVVEGGLVVLYRDRSEAERRDIAWIRWDGERWSAPRVLDPEPWVIRGCPVNGPAVAAAGRRVAAAWYSGAGGRGRAFVSFSGDAGVSFGRAIPIDEGAPLGRVDVELLPDGRAAVVWLEGGKAPRLLARTVAADGRKGPELKIAAGSSARSSGFPRLAAAGAGVVVAWTEGGSTPRIRVALVSF